MQSPIRTGPSISAPQRLLSMRELINFSQSPVPGLTGIPYHLNICTFNVVYINFSSELCAIRHWLVLNPRRRVRSLRAFLFIAFISITGTPPRSNKLPSARPAFAWWVATRSPLLLMSESIKYGHIFPASVVLCLQICRVVWIPRSTMANPKLSGLLSLPRPVCGKRKAANGSTFTFIDQNYNSCLYRNTECFLCSPLFVTH